MFENRGPMKTTKSFGEYPKYSLHDARVQKIAYGDGNLTFIFDYIFSYENGVEQTHKAKIVFEKCDVDDLEILVFNSTILDTFTGKRIELLQYQQDYSVNVNIRMYNFDDVQCTVIPSVAYGFVTGMNLQLC